MRINSRATILAALLAAVTTAPAAGGQGVIAVDGDEVTITGCLARPSALAPLAPTVLVWARGDVTLVAPASGRPPAVGTSGSQRLFYWIDHKDDLVRHVGQRVEIKGDFEDFETGEIDFDRDGEWVEMELDLGGREEKARVPASWFGPAVPDDGEVRFVARKVDVEDVRILGACY